MAQLTIRGKTSNLEDHEVYEGLRKLWQAQRAGDSSASLDWGRSLVPGEVSPSMLSKHVEQHERVLAQEGVELPPPVYAPGSVVLSVGDTGFKVARRRWEEMPEISEQLETLWRLIRREERRVIDVPLNKISMRETGEVSWGDGDFFLELPALRQLLKLSGRFGSAVPYLASVAPPLRCQHWNSEVTSSTDGSKGVRLRLRRNPLTGRFSVFAVVTLKYGVLDIDNLAVGLASSLPTEGMRGSVFYDSALTNLRIDGHWEQSYVFDGPAQDIFRCGVQIRSNDTGNGGIWVLPTAMRILTHAQISLARASTSENNPLYHTIHQGEMSRVVSGVTNGVAKAANRFVDFESAWRSLRSLKSPYRLGGSVTEEAALEYICRVFLDKGRHSFGISRDDLLPMMISCHRVESTGTAADLVNAVGRLHASSEMNQYQRESLEEEMLTVVNWFAGRSS